MEYQDKIIKAVNTYVESEIINKGETKMSVIQLKASALKNTKIHNCMLICSIILVFSICLYLQNRYPETIFFNTYPANEQATIFDKIYQEHTVTQIVDRPVEDILEVQINLATWGKSSFDGILTIQVLNNKKLVGKQQINCKDIYDGYVASVDLFDRSGKIGDEFQIEFESTNSSENPIGIWAYSDYNGFNAKLLTDDKELISGITALRIKFANCNMGKIWWLFLAWIIIVGLFKFGTKLELCYNKKITLFTLLFLISFFIFNLRGGVFSYSQLYAEDAVYLSRIVNEGFWKSCFTTRSGSGADFLNLGSYIMLEIAWSVNRVVYGFNLLYLPRIIGLISSVFYACVAVYAYYVLDKTNHMLGIFAYFTTIIIPVGIDTPEIYGRVLNSVFIFPFLGILLILDLWENRLSFSIKNSIFGILLLICGLSFPISFGALGIYLVYGIWNSAKEKKVLSFLKGNCVLFIALIIGVLLLPTMMGSQGASVEFETKPEALTEFILARHMLYPFIYIFYGNMNDTIVVVISAIMYAIVLLAIYLEYKEQHQFGKYMLLSVMTTLCILASALMRLPMSELFDDYQNTFPDRYYYACNIMFAITILYGIYIVCSKRKKALVFFDSMAIIVVISMCANDSLFFQEERDSGFLKGNIEENNWKECLEQAYLDGDEGNGKYMVIAPPYASIVVELPEVYVWSSINY